MVEVNSETDFVARNDHFQGLVKMIADVALDAGSEDIEAIKAAKAGSMTVADAISSAIATIGENITLRRAAVLSVGQGVVASYVHNQVSEGLGKIGVLVALESSGNAERTCRASAGRSRCISRRPIRSRSMPPGVDPAVVKREKDILADKFRQQGKPEAMIEKITESGPEDLLQGADPARAALHLRRQEERRAGAEGSRRQGRRADQGHALSRVLRSARASRRRPPTSRRRSRRQAERPDNASAIRRRRPNGHARLPPRDREGVGRGLFAGRMTSASTRRPSRRSSTIWWRRARSASPSASWSAAAI